MENEIAVEIEVFADSVREAGGFAAELEQRITMGVDGAQLQRRRVDDTNQDLGSILVLAFASPLVVAVVKELGNWMALRYRARMRLKRTTASGEKRELDVTGPIDNKKIEVLRDFFEN